MSTDQTCPKCGVLNKIAGLTSLKPNAVMPEPVKRVKCWSCAVPFTAAENAEPAWTGNGHHGNGQVFASGPSGW